MERDIGPPGSVDTNADQASRHSGKESTGGTLRALLRPRQPLVKMETAGAKESRCGPETLVKEPHTGVTGRSTA